MSAVFKNAKKKVSQTELRRFMTEHKNKLKPVQKIDSPLAKYTDNGQLTCILCKSIVRSEAVWKVHLNAKQHKENIELAKKLKEQTHNFTVPKRAGSPTETNVPNKKIKGILKNSSSTSSSSAIPDDFFDNKNATTTTTSNKIEVIQNDTVQTVPEKPTKAIVEQNNPELLPEGFFDDPKQDAKARNLEYKDPVEEEWERFQKELKDVDNKSAEIIAEDQEEATTERQIDEIEEQMRNWNRVLDLEKKKEDVKVAPVEDVEMEEASEDDDDNFDEYLDWRSKKSFK